VLKAVAKAINEKSLLAFMAVSVSLCGSGFFHDALFVVDPELWGLDYWVLQKVQDVTPC
jgi:hypothetical protein